MSQAANGPKTLFLTQLTDVKTAALGDVEGIGTLRQEGDKWYRWVKNSESSALVAGMPVCYQSADAEAYHESVGIPASADLNTLAGISMGAIPALGFGWIEIEGYHASILFSIGKTDITAGINAYPADTVSYLVGSDQQSATQVSVLNQMIGRVQLLVSIASSTASGGGSDAGTTAAGGWIHCLTV